MHRAGGQAAACVPAGQLLAVAQGGAAGRSRPPLTVWVALGVDGGGEAVAGGGGDVQRPQVVGDGDGGGCGRGAAPLLDQRAAAVGHLGQGKRGQGRVRLARGSKQQVRVVSAGWQGT